VYARIVRKPIGQEPGVIDVYYDPSGQNRVADSLITQGLYLTSEPPTINTPPFVAMETSESSEHTHYSKNLKTLSLLREIVNQSH